MSDIGSNLITLGLTPIALSYCMFRNWAGEDMALHPLDTLTILDQFKAAPFPPGYPALTRTFYSPVDNIHGALMTILKSAQKSLVVAQYGFDDSELASVIKGKLVNEHCFVQLTLDKSQAAGVHERKILAAQRYPASSIAIGNSEKGAIQHMKMIIVDGVFTVTGSTNWSASGESKQDNQMSIVQDAYIAAEARARIDCIHSSMLMAQGDSG